ncbi:MAG: glucosamine-6-phosphate deaminase [Bacillota bacterium]
MRLIIEDNYKEISKKAALMVASQITLKPDSVLGLATGSTPLGMYSELINMYREDEVNFAEAITFNLDEYYGLDPENETSYHYYMKNNFFDHINIKAENINIPDGMTDDVVNECKKYEKAISHAGGIDLQVLGIGANGHIGFNEPDEKLNVTTGLVNLRKETIEANSRFFESEKDVPKKALSVGMATILKARRIILLASGKNKAEAIRATVSGCISTEVPSSLLQTHPEITLIVDKEAASLINKDKTLDNFHFKICENTVR